jgi:hypothetical protein
VCGASALFWDSWEGLIAFLAVPGNARWADRVVQINGVKHLQQERRVWAVLVGACQFTQHFNGYRPRANCILEFDVSKGFNNGEQEEPAGVSTAALKLKIATRNGAGVSAGSPLLLNYGMSFDFGAACTRFAADTAIFKGALDALFDSQKNRLPVEAAENAGQAKQEAEEETRKRKAQEELEAKKEAKKKTEEDNRKRKREEEEAKAQEEAKRLKVEEEEKRGPKMP